MINKVILFFVLLTAALLLTSCRGGNTTEIEDYKNLKAEYQEEYEDLSLRYGYLSKTYIENSFDITEEECPHIFGNGYIKDKSFHTYACKRCFIAVGDPETHSDIKITNFNFGQNVYAYGKSCSVCSREPVRYSDSVYFEYIITNKNIEESEVYYGLKIYE